MTIPKDLDSVIMSDPETLGGTPCFTGTRVPLATLLDHVESGFSLERFLQGYSSVHRDQALAVLEWQGEQTRHLLGLDLR